MQIHEITGGRRRDDRLDEGLWDTLKGVGSALKNSKWTNSAALAKSREDDKLKKQSAEYVSWLTKEWQRESPQLLSAAYAKKYGAPVHGAQPQSAQSKPLYQTPAEKTGTRNLSEDTEDNEIYQEVFSAWLADKLKTNVSGYRITLADAERFDPRLTKQLQQQMSRVVSTQSPADISAYISTALTGLQNLSRDVTSRIEKKKAASKEKRLKSLDQLDQDGEDETPYDHEVERKFTVVNPEGERDRVYVKDDEYYVKNTETDELEKVEDETEIENIQQHDPEVTGEPSDEEIADEMPPEDSELTQVKSPEELEVSAKKVAADRSNTPNVPETKHDYRVISFTPSLIIRYKNQEFMMDDENYPQRDWYKLPNGTPVKSEPMIRLLNNFATEAFDEQDIMSAHGEPESDIDVGASENAGVRVEPGTKLRLLDPRNNGVYYKDALGNWSTEEGRRLKKPETIKYLENKAKTNGQTRVEKVLPPTPEEKKRGATS